MPIKVVRNDITKMHVDAIVNTANRNPLVGPGCDHAVYQAAGYEELLAYRREKIGIVSEGEVFITPGFGLDCRFIIHAVSPPFIDGKGGEEEKLRSCYRKSLELALYNEVKTIAFPLISTGSFGYPMEEGFRIAADEINAFLLKHRMLVYLVVFGEEATNLGRRIYPDLESYIDRNYVREKEAEEYDMPSPMNMREARRKSRPSFSIWKRKEKPKDSSPAPLRPEDTAFYPSAAEPEPPVSCQDMEEEVIGQFDGAGFDEDHESALKERMEHLSDTFSEYLVYLITSRGMSFPEVYKRAIVDKKAFSKIKNNPDAHPKKITAMCLCVGARLNMDQTRDLLARAGYALSPCDKTDIIFSYFIENGIYDMIELDIMLEEYGQPCLIS